MPVVKIADAGLHYRIDGPEEAPVLILSNSLGARLEMWDAQIPDLAASFRVLRYDTRGHGGSSVTAGAYSIDQLGRDVLAMAEALDIERFSFCGLSMGGLVGQWLGIHAGDRLERLVLCNTAARIANDEIWNSRIDAIEAGGPQAMADLASDAGRYWFTPEFMAASPAEVARVTGMIGETSPRGYMACCAAIRDADFRTQLAQIRIPVLMVCGRQDAVTRLTHGRFIQAHIAGAQLLELPAAHLSNVEAAGQFNRDVLAFLQP